MDTKSFMNLGVALGLGLAACGSAIGLGMAVAAALSGISRQPEATNKIMMNMIIGCAFIEAITIYILVFAFMYATK